MMIGTITIEATDVNGLSLQKDFVITVNDINDETATLDIDGNGALGSSDYALINLYASFGNDPDLFNVFLANNADVLLGENPTLTTGEDIVDYLTNAKDIFFDLDGNETVESSDYLLLNLYGSFGADSELLDIFLQQNSDVLLGENPTRTTGMDIVNYLAQYSIN